ncbi:MAG: ABC transporter substrate-binding protein [Actinomycetota bacterium]
MGPIGSLDPVRLDSSDALLIAAQMFDGLVDYEPETLAVRPAVARSWRMLDGGRAFRFRLRLGVRFHDGTQVRAQDFVRAWNRIADPAFASPYAFLLEPVLGYRTTRFGAEVRRLSGLAATTERTLDVRLRYAWPDFIALLAHPALSPVPVTAGFPRYSARPIGNGPFRLIEDVGASDDVRLERFPDYYGTSPEVSTLTFQAFDNLNEAWPQFLAERLDVAPAPPGLVSEAAASFGRRGMVTLSHLLYCGFNRRQARLADARLSRAVSLAIDRERLVAGVYGPLATPATGIVPPGIPGARGDACGRDCEHAIERASELVETLPRGSRSFHLDYAASPVGDEIALEIRRQLAEVGLRVRPRAHASRRFSELFRRKKHEFFCLTWVAEYPRQQALLEPLLLGESADNRTGVDRPGLNQLLAAAREETDAARREERYAEIEERAMHAMPVSPLAWFRSRLVVRPSLQDFTLTPLGWFDVAALSTSP